MQWQDPERVDHNTVRIPERWLYLHYYEAFNLLFRVENALRLLVYVVLKREHGPKWDELSISE